MDPNSSNAVVSKLQSAIANFRREKDAAQRNRDLALERLKASAATFESEQAKTTLLQSKLDAINRKISAGNGQEVAQQRAENDRLEREVSAIRCSEAVFGLLTSVLASLAISLVTVHRDTPHLILLLYHFALLLNHYRRPTSSTPS